MPKPNYLLTAFEILCVILVLFGLAQNFDGASRWQYEIMTNWSSVFVLLGAMVVLSLLIAMLVQRKDPDRNGNIHSWLQDISAYYLVYMISGYAFAKLLKTQFQPPNYVLETPIGDLNGFWLTWTYFGYSETFANILGYTQIAGSILLLFRKTRLLGAFVLIPVMVNICLIDHFYEISPLAYYNALHYTFMLFLFSALDAKKLMEIFFGHEGIRLPAWKVLTVNAIRVLVVVLAFYKIYSLRESVGHRTQVNGVWKINKVNRQDGDLTAFSKIYVEWRYGALFKADPTLFSPRDRSAGYEVDTEKSKLKFKLYPSDQYKSQDSLLVEYKFESDSLMVLEGYYNADSVRMELKRIK